jgi:hypothetical protein
MLVAVIQKTGFLRLSFGLDGFFRTGSVISFGLDISNIESFSHTR